LYRIRNALRAGGDKLSPRQVARLGAGLQAGDPHCEVTVAWHCYQQLRSAFSAASLHEGNRIAHRVRDSFHTCPVPEIARLGRALRTWRTQLVAYFTNARANNGGTEAIKGIIELHRRIARGFRNPHNFRLRMILAAGALIARVLTARYSGDKGAVVSEHRLRLSVRHGRGSTDSRLTS
jgi:hypothetical protein